MKILLIAGHGAGDPGATAHGFIEANLAREVVAKLKEHLSEYADVKVFDTNKKMSKYLCSNSFNFKEYDYVFEVHFNAIKKELVADGNLKGTEILVHKTEKNTSVEKVILDNICTLGYKNRGIKPRNDLMVMNVCKGNQGVSYALLEVCFIDDIDDMRLYNEKKDDTIKAVADGIIKGFGLSKSVNLFISAEDITNELKKSHFPISEPEKFIKELEEARKNNSSLYWGFYKIANRIK